MTISRWLSAIGFGGEYFVIALGQPLHHSRIVRDGAASAVRASSVAKAKLRQ